MGKFFRWLLMAAADGGPRWMRAKVRILLASKAKLISAFTGDLKVDGAFGTATEAPLLAQPAHDMFVSTGAVTSTTANAGAQPARELTPNGGIWAGVKAALVAYRLAVCAFVRWLPFGTKAEIIAAGATEMERSARVCAETKAKAETAGAMEMNRVAQIAPVTTAQAQTAQAQTVPVTHSGVPADTTAEIYTVKSAVAASTPVVPAATRARLMTWIEPEFVDGVLILRQAYSASITDGALEVR